MAQGWAAGRLSLHDRIHMTSLGWNEVTYCALLNLNYWVFLIVHSQVMKLWLSCCLVLLSIYGRPGSGTVAFSWPNSHIVFPRWCEWDGCWETSTHQFSYVSSVICSLKIQLIYFSIYSIWRAAMLNFLFLWQPSRLLHLYTMFTNDFLVCNMCTNL